MIGCERVTALLGDYVSRRLPGSERVNVDWHLAFCPFCSGQAEGYFEVVSLAASLAPPVLPSTVERRLLAAVAAAAARPRSGSEDETRPEKPLP